VGFFACGEIADDDFPVAFEREEAVGEVVTVVGEDLACEGSPGIEVFCGDGTLLRGGDGAGEAEKSQGGEECAALRDALDVAHGSPGSV
jgi:hypothetical protein